MITNNLKLTQNIDSSFKLRVKKIKELKILDRFELVITELKGGQFLCTY